MTRHLVTSRPYPVICLRCGSLVLVGLSEGIEYRIDVEPINYAGEIAAILDDIPTWEMCAGAVVGRDAHRIKNTTDATRVLASHRCRRTVPDTHRNPLQLPIVVSPCDCPPNEGHSCPPPF